MCAAVTAICVTALTPPPDRTKRVKDARSEAQKEIETYRKEKEDEFQKFEKEVCLSGIGSHLA
jgi:V-type H+-transporting ATPase subunit G